MNFNTRKFIPIVFILSLILNSSFCKGQLIQYHFDQIDSLQKIEKRNLLVFIHKDWCKFCEIMKNTSFIDPKIINLINKNFYYIDLNAEHREDIFYKGKLYSFSPSGLNTGIHNLAVELTLVDKKINFPTICLLNSNNEIIHLVNHYLNPKDFLELLNKWMN